MYSDEDFHYHDAETFTGDIPEMILDDFADDFPNNSKFSDSDMVDYFLEKTFIEVVFDDVAEAVKGTEESSRMSCILKDKMKPVLSS